MLFVDKFSSHLKQYITHDMPNLFFLNCLLFQYELSKLLPIQSQKLKKDTRAAPLTSLIYNIVNIDVLNTEQLSHLSLVIRLLHKLIHCWDEWYHKQKLSKKNIFVHLILQLLQFVLRYI